jgi:hypothetical protein
VIPVSARAAYSKRPENMAKGMEVNTQTAKKDFGPNGAEVDSLGITSARNVVKWTGIFSVTILHSRQINVRPKEYPIERPPRPPCK